MAFSVLVEYETEVLSNQTKVREGRYQFGIKRWPDTGQKPWTELFERNLAIVIQLWETMTHDPRCPHLPIVQVEPALPFFDVTNKVFVISFLLCFETKLGANPPS